MSSLVMSVAALMLISMTARAVHFRLFQTYFKLSFENAPVWSLLYFSAWAAVVAIAFPTQIAELFAPISILGYIALTFLLVVAFPALYHLLRVHDGRPEWLIAAHPDEGMLTLGERYILAKVADVVFQQFIAGAMILVMAGGGVPYPIIVGVFVALFAGAHFYIFKTDGLAWGLYYTTYAALAGFAFPFLILFVPAGVAYAIIVHMLFYVLSGVFFAELPRPGEGIKEEFGTA